MSSHPRHAIDPGRVLRALGFKVARLGPASFRVTGGSTAHKVRLHERDRWACDCSDAAFRPSQRCKHLIAVYLWRQLAPPVREALRQALPEQRSLSASRVRGGAA